MAVTSLEITRRSIVLEGRPFGEAGAYEKIVGVLRLGVDPGHQANQAVTDLALAPRNGAGLVESAADFYLLRPVDPSRGNRRLLLDIPNRGRKVALGMFNSTIRVPDPTSAEEFGNGFLMRHGYTVAWCGWQHDVPRQDGLLALTVPVARGDDGPISGPVLCEWRPNARVETLPMADRYHIAQPTADLDDPAARLTVREHAGAPAVAIARSAWRFADATHISLSGGFEPGKIYELVYRAENPPLVGLGLLAVRDTAAWLRSGPASAGNPCAGELERAYVIGVSQTGRFLRHLLYLGLNEDEAGRKVLDGVIAHIAGARRGEFNQRFGQPSLNATCSVGSLFPFTDTSALDRVTGTRGAQLARLEARDTVPKIVAVNTSAEYWRGDASLVHADVEAPATWSRIQRRDSISSPAASTRPARCRRPRRIPTPARADCTRSMSWTTRRSCARCWRTSTAGSPTASSRRRAPCRASPTAPGSPPRPLGRASRGSRGRVFPIASSGRGGSISARTSRGASSTSCRRRSAHRS